MALDAEPKDSLLQVQVQRLQHLMVCGRWLVVTFLWLVVGSLSLWELRADIDLMLDYFTWTALRYALAYNFLAMLGLALCVGMTLAVLVWQSRNILFGLPRRERKRFEVQVLRIRDQGPSHPLWKWVCR